MDVHFTLVILSTIPSVYSFLRKSWFSLTWANSCECKHICAYMWTALQNGSADSFVRLPLAALAAEGMVISLGFLHPWVHSCDTKHLHSVSVLSSPLGRGSSFQASRGPILSYDLGFWRIRLNPTLAPHSSSFFQSHLNTSTRQSTETTVLVHLLLAFWTKLWERVWWVNAIVRVVLVRCSS